MNPKTVCSKVLPSPPKPVYLPSGIQWLSGEGCGSWFYIEALKDGFIISRYSPEGKLECSGLFRQVSGPTFKIDSSYSFTYMSHCAEINIRQDNQKLTFKSRN
ncbi:DUF6695 family protein [Elizabethkingia miricola]|uniref:DUF6695 domain-containing protein n=1 Tax=Elizabethkingia miricola TaxID=172045 RepID=A0ABD5B839_ELIMR|nr:DUF6695 family protein [Elizabethkingia miricola]MDQ8750064.1 hypothetical protein [Elizabethkingia miricola]